MKNLIMKHVNVNYLAVAKFFKANGISESSGSNDDNLSARNLVIYLVGLLMILPVITAFLMIYLGIF